jgi:alanyl-tRNA synthetase
LLLGEGVVPGPKRHGHVLRRLMRRAFVDLALLGVSPCLLADLVGAAAAAHRHWSAFPPLDATARDLVRAEAVDFETLMAKGEREYSRLARDGGPLTAESLFRLKSERGVPVDILLAWSRRDGAEVDGSELADRMSAERTASRDRFAPRTKIG